MDQGPLGFHCSEASKIGCRVLGSLGMQVSLREQSDHFLIFIP